MILGLVFALPPAWASGSVRQQVAHAEYESVRNPVILISKQRIVDVWNQYVKEIGAPDEAIVSVADFKEDIHEMGDARELAGRIQSVKKVGLREKIGDIRAEPSVELSRQETRLPPRMSKNVLVAPGSRPPQVAL